MNMQERAELLALLNRLRAETVATLLNAREYLIPENPVRITLEKHRDDLSEIIDEMHGKVIDS